MEKTDINKILYAFADPDGCWHEWEGYPNEYSLSWCKKCREKMANVLVRPNPDYTSEDSPRRLLAEVEAKFAENRYAAYEDKLFEVVKREHDSAEFREYNNSYISYLMISASALTRSTAMAEYLKDHEQEA